MSIRECEPGNYAMVDGKPCIILDRNDRRAVFLDGTTPPLAPIDQIPVFRVYRRERIQLPVPINSDLSMFADWPTEG